MRNDTIFSKTIMTKKTDQKVVLITGSSSGFGLLIAARLALKGHKVIATMRNLNKKEELLQRLLDRGGDVQILPLDVTKIGTIRQTVNQVIEEHGRIDILINNAGFGMGGFFEDLSDEEIHEQFDVNFFGVQNVTRVILPYMRRQEKGRIINISSMAGFSASPCFSAYNASKWALEAFSESLYYELKPFGINVVLVEPGTYKTKIFHDNARMAKNFHNEQSPYYARSQKLHKMVMDYVNGLKRDPDEVARLVEKLCEKKNPPLRNITNIPNKFAYFLRRFLPLRVWTWMMEKIY